MRFLHAAVAVIGLTAMWSCGDATGPAGRRIGLSVVPVFAGAEGLLGVGSDVDSFIVRISNPPAPDYDTSIVIPPGQDSIALLIQVLVSEAEDTITVQFNGYSSATGLLLYQGSQSLTIKAGISGAQVPVTADYVGPGAGIDSVVVSPDAAALLVGQTLTLDYTGFDADAPLVDDSVPVRWASLDTTLATVTAAGVVTARADGTARIVVTSVAKSALKDTSAIMIVTDVVPPAIGLASTAATFATTAGGAIPTAQTIAVTNAGSGTLSGLAVGTITYGAGASGWLTATLTGTTAPTDLSLQPNTAALAAGTYTATVPVTASGASNSPQSVSVTFTVGAGPAIGLSPSSITFTTSAGATAPAAQTINLTNTGGGTLSGLALGTITYGPGASGWLSLSLSAATAPATITLTPGSLPTTAGTYTASFPVTSPVASNSPQTVSVSLTVNPGPATTLTVTPGYGVVRPTLTQALTLAARDAFNNVVPTTSATYVSRTPAVATVNTSGVVTAVTGGASVIVVTLGSVSDSTVIAVANNFSTVVSAIADGRAFRTASVNDTVRVLVAVDLSGVSPEKLGSYNAQLNWGTTALRYVRSETVAGGFVAPTLNETQTASGQLRFGAADATGAAGPTVGLVRVVFVANASGSTPLTLAVTELSAAGTFVNLLQTPYAALVLGGNVKVQ